MHFVTSAQSIKKAVQIFSLSCAALLAQQASATKVQIQTVMGDIEVNLYDKTTPKTVENFLAYVKSGAYTNSVIHRAVPDFIVQGGGFKWEGKSPLTAIGQNAAVINEPVYSNLRGTIAMAKLGGNPNSATNQWFFNLKDNSANLDTQNGGFTVFGQVTGNGMAIIDAMAALNANVADKEQIPLRNYTAEDAKNNVVITDKNLIIIQGIVVLDESPDTAANLTPVKNTLLLPNNGDVEGKNGGGGSFDWTSLLMLLGFAAMMRTRSRC